MAIPQFIQFVTSDAFSPKLTIEQANYLSSLTYVNTNESLFSNTQNFFDIIEILLFYFQQDSINGYQKAISYLSNVNHPSQITWNPELFEEQYNNQNKEFIIITTKDRVVSGLMVCKNCGSKDVAIISITQRRSADEPATVKIKCRNCGIESNVNG
jgi:DNA-directed RNA polymerase subunit M/transcription elongation factor TFIIS